MRSLLALPHDRRRRAMAAFALCAVVVAGAVVLAVTEERAGRAVAPAAAVRVVPADPLAAEFARCQALGDAGARDARCLSAWAQSRRRFLMLDRPAVTPAPAALGGR